MLLGCHLKSVALAYVASQSHVQPSLGEEVVDQGGGGGFAVGSGDADLFRIVVPGGKLDFGDDAGTLGGKFANQRGLLRDARALDHLVGVEYQLTGVTALLVTDFPAIEHCRILLLNLSVVGKKHIKAFYLGEDCGSHAALGSSQYN